MTKVFKKSLKTLFWGHFRPFLPILGKIWIFLEKKGLRKFLNMSIIKRSLSCAKNTFKYNYILPLLTKTPSLAILSNTNKTSRNIIIGKPLNFYDSKLTGISASWQTECTTWKTYPQPNEAIPEINLFQKKKRLYDFGGVVEASYSSWNNVVFTA